MKLKKLKTNPSKKTTLIVVISVVLAGILGVSAYALYVNNSSDSDKSEYETNLERTDAEKEASKNLEENPEQKLENDQNDTPATPEQSSSTGKYSVNVLLTTAGVYNGKVNAGGMVTDRVEEGGTCTYIFTKGSETISKTTDTLVNPTSTSCKAVNFSSDELPSAGTWKVKLTYSSESSEGTSNEKEITK